MFPPISNFANGAANLSVSKVSGPIVNADLPSPKGESNTIAFDLNDGDRDGILATGRFPAQADMLRLYRSLATMNRSVRYHLWRTRNPFGLKQLNWSAAGASTCFADWLERLDAPTRPGKRSEADTRT
jgi:hypothetical protein